MKYKELVTSILKHNYLYYDLSEPELSDKEYDILYDQLELIEEKQGWKLSNSPTISIGGQAGKVKHPFKLYSLKKIYDKSEINPEFTIQTPKIDGTNLTLIYELGELKVAMTRGDGEYGDNITNLAKLITGVYNGISSPLDKYKILAITGECVTNNKNITNFRNYVSGALGLKDEEEFKTRNIKFIAHDLFGVELPYTTKMEYLNIQGFFTVYTENLDNYPQDGIVYRVDNYIRSKELGYTSKYPRFAVALKSKEVLIAATILQKVEWSVGRTGTVNPVGIVDPIEIDGAIITRVTLHNIDIIEKNNLGLGDLIQIERAGGVIPKFNKILHHSLHNHKIKQEDAEKAINGKTHRIGPKLFVTDKEKHGTVKLLNHFIKTIGIKGLGPQSIKKLDLNHPADLYINQNWDLLGVNGEKIKAEIVRSETKPYKLVLASLGIEGVGKSASEKITNIILSFDRLKDIELYDIPSIGPKTKEKIVIWLDENEDWVKKLPLQLKSNIDITDIIKRKICISGKLDVTKNELAEQLEQFNINVVNTMTKDCYALISDGKESSKFKKAKLYNVKVINYWEEKINILKGQL